MQLEEIRAELRPRTPEEAVDLGLAMTRTHFARIAKLWANLILPLWVVILALFYQSPVWGLVILCWMQPIFDRIPLMVLSQELFGAGKGLAEQRKEGWRLMRSNLWTDLVRERIGVSRCIDLPVNQLEGLKGKAAKQRRMILSRQSAGVASMLTFQTQLFIMGVAFGGMFFVLGVLPDFSALQWEAALESSFGGGDFSLPKGLQWAIVLSYLAANFLIQPFYIGAGFALYLNARSLSEGWDIEVNFKRISQRVTQLGKRALILFLFGICLIQHAEADQEMPPPSGDQSIYATEPVDKGEAKQAVKEVMSRKEFEVQTVEVEERSNEGGGTSISPLIPASLVMVLFWSMIAAALGFVIYHLVKWLSSRQSRTPADLPRKPAVTSVMGMSVEPESLPSNLPELAWQWWNEGKHAEAVALLYRGAISWFVVQQQLEIREGDTEGDCLRRVKDGPEDSKRVYFKSLTEMRILVSYAKSLPPEHQVQAMCENWPFRDQVKPGVAQ